jgi:two-component system response regulator BaeR
MIAQSLVKALLRRSRAPRAAAISSRLLFDARRHEATLDGEPLDLTPVEFRLLNALAERPDWVFSREQLLDRVYADHRIVSDRSIDSHVRNLRRKLKAAGRDENIVKSIYGIGYKLDL